MATMYAGEPMPMMGDAPLFQPSALGPSLYTLGNIRYRVGDNSLTIYSFENDSVDGDASTEDDMDDESDCDSDSDQYARGILHTPDSSEGDQGQIMEGLHEPSDGNADRAAGDAACAGGVGESSNAPAGPSTDAAGPSNAPDAGAPSGSPRAYWVARSRGSVPRDAVLVGADKDGGPLFVGRACVYGELLAGKVAAHHRVCYVASEGRELAFEKYEVLVVKRGRVEWVRGRDGSFPFDAFPAGLTLRDQRVYVARACVNGVLTPGRLVVGESECRISYDVKEYKFPEYDILTLKYMEPDGKCMVRYVSADNLFSSEGEQNGGRSNYKLQITNWCATDDMDDYSDQEEEEEDDEEDEEEMEELGVGSDDEVIIVE